MKLDEFAFVNHQLAGMLKAGIPLEGALRQIAATLHQGPLRDELRALEGDLASGVPLRDALGRRRLPVFYSRMLEVGALGNDLPALLTLLADYYQRLHVTWVRLKGLIFYPGVVLAVSLLVSLLVAVIFGQFSREMLSTFGQLGGPTTATPRLALLHVGIWLPVVALGLISGAALLVMTIPRWRESLRWRLPGFREAGLSNLASATALMMQNGCSLNQALALIEHLESGSPMGREVSRWQARLADGHRQFHEVAGGGKVTPPLFIWLVASGGEDWLSGFRHAADVYYERARQRTEVILYAVLPASVLALGFLILVQILPLARVFGGLTGGLFNSINGF